MSGVCNHSHWHLLVGSTRPRWRAAPTLSRKRAMPTSVLLQGRPSLPRERVRGPVRSSMTAACTRPLLVRSVSASASHVATWKVSSRICPMEWRRGVNSWPSRRGLCEIKFLMFKFLLCSVTQTQHAPEMSAKTTPSHRVHGPAASFFVCVLLPEDLRAGFTAVLPRGREKPSSPRPSCRTGKQFLNREGGCGKSSFHSGSAPR